jgi:hypothetical protein
MADKRMFLTGLHNLRVTGRKCPIYCFCDLCNADNLITVLYRAEYMLYICSWVAHS